MIFNKQNIISKIKESQQSAVVMDRLESEFENITTHDAALKIAQERINDRKTSNI